MDLENVSQKGWKWHPLLLERYLLKVKRIDSGSKDIMDIPTGGIRNFNVGTLILAKDAHK